MANIVTAKFGEEDSFGGSRIGYNNNFQLIEDSINKITSLLDTDNNMLDNIKSVRILTTAGTNNTVTSQPSITTLETNGTAKIDGNILCGNSITAKTLTLDQGSGITLSTGGINIVDSSATLQTAGNVQIGGQTVFTSYQTSFNAASRLSYITGGTNLLLNPTDPAGPIGLISMVGKHSLILDFQTYSGSGNTDVRMVKLLTDGITVGHEIRLIILINEEANVPYTVDLRYETLAYTASNPLAVGVTFTRCYSIIDLVYGGNTTGWIITNERGTGITLS